MVWQKLEKFSPSFRRILFLFMRDTEKRIKTSKAGTAVAISSWLAIPAEDFLLETAAGVVKPLRVSNSPQTFLLHTYTGLLQVDLTFITYMVICNIFITRLQFLLHTTNSYYTIFFYYTVFIFITQYERVIMHSLIILITHWLVLLHTITHKGLSKSQMIGLKTMFRRKLKNYSRNTKDKAIPKFTFRTTQSWISLKSCLTQRENKIFEF